jgi:hypothetical protein
MTRHTLSRRGLLRGTVHLAIVGAVPALLHGCTKEEFSCTDISGLSRKDLELRTALKYVDRSPHEETKNCANCAFFVEGSKNQCGNCTLVQGPIHPLGYCSSWAAKG